MARAPPATTSRGEAGSYRLPELFARRPEAGAVDRPRLEAAGFRVWWDDCSKGGERFSADHRGRARKRRRGRGAVVEDLGRLALGAGTRQTPRARYQTRRLFPVSLDGSLPPVWVLGNSSPST
jgi:hypothetical protein